MGFTPKKGPVEEFHAAASVSMHADKCHIGGQLSKQAETLRRAIIQQMNWLQEWKRAAQEGGVDRTTLPETFDIVHGMGLWKCTPQEIQKMPGYKELHDICAAPELDVQIRFVKNDDGGVRGIRVDVSKKYAESPADECPLCAKPQQPQNFGRCVP